MRVLMSPASDDSNPYLRLLSSAMIRKGVDVVPYTRTALRDERFDVWHLHWPENVLVDGNTRHAIRYGSSLLSRLALAKARGTKIVWTAHNLLPHKPHNRLVAASFWQIFSSLVDGVLSLSQTAAQQLSARHPRLGRKVIGVTPHGDYGGIYPDHLSSSQARGLLGFGPEHTVLLFFGRILRYKNVEALMDNFRELDDPNLRLVVTGACDDTQLLSSLRSLANTDERICFRPRPVPSAEVQHYLRSADAMVLPFRKILNSGSVMLSLTFSLPTLAPHAGSMPELQAAVGDRWLRLYEGRFTSSHLKEAVDWVRQGSRPQHCALDDFSWDTIAKKTIACYETVLSNGPAGVVLPAD